VQGIKDLLQCGCPPTYSNRVGQTALHIGAMWGSIDAVKVLLKARADPNQQNQLRGSAPLHAVAMGKGPTNKRAECAKVIIDFKGNPNQRDKTGESPLDAADEEVVRVALGGAPLVLHNAVRTHRLQDLKDAVQKVSRGKVQNLTLDSCSGDGDTALHIAVASGWDEAVELLLEAFADPSRENATQRAPVHTAVLAGNHVILRALLHAKADVSATDCDPDHDFRFSSTSFQETPDKHRTALHYAASLCNVIAIQALLEAKANVNVDDSNSKTPLHLCVELRKSSDIDTGYGVRVHGLETKLEWNNCLGAAIGPPLTDETNGNVRCPVLLQGQIPSKGVLIKPSNLDITHEEALDLLLDAKADVTAGNHSIGESRTVLHEASRLGDTSLARKLLVARANLDQVDSKQGLSALHLAARGRQSEVVRLLVQARAQVGLPALNGKTAADFAKANGASTEILDILAGNSMPTSDLTTPAKQDTVAGLTKDQRMALFID